MDKLMTNPRHWRDRAEEARAHADDMKDPEAKRIMHDVADGYERLAVHAEERLKDALGPYGRR